MIKQQVIMSSGKAYDLPLFDPVVAEHFSNPASNTATLLEQINREKIYAGFFSGKHGLTFLDIGANIGLVSIYAAPSCKRIVAVEPAPQTFAVLEAMTHSFDNIERFKAALAPTDGQFDFFTNDINSTASSTVNTYGTKSEVRGFSLTSLLRIHQLEQVDIVKVDAEGGEGESLSFAELEAAKLVVKSYMIETHNCPKTTWEHKLGTLVSYLSKLGYSHQRVNGMALSASR